MRAEPLRIEMLLPSLPRAGMEMVAATLARALRERGHEVGFTCIQVPGELGEELRDAGFRVSEVPAPGLRPNLIASELGPWFARVQPDVVHVHNGVWLKAVQGARRAGVRTVIYTLHGIDLVEPWYLRYLNRAAARRTSHIVTVSESLRAYALRSMSVAPAVVSVIPNGVDTMRFRPGPRSAAARKILGVADDRAVIGTVARLDPVKNHALLLSAFARLREARPDVFLALIGDGPCRPQLERQIAELGLRDHVCITGVQADPAPLLRELDVFALSSDIEGTSISILEAMATALPVVATAVGGTPSLLRHGGCGMLTPSGNVEALAAALLRLLGDPTEAGELGKRARREVESHHSVEHMTASYEDIYAGFGRSAPVPGLETVS